MLFSPYILLDISSDKKDIVNLINNNKIKEITIGYITNETLSLLYSIIPYINNNLTLTLSFDLCEKNQISELFTIISNLILNTKCFKLDFVITDSNNYDIKYIDNVNKVIYQLQQQFVNLIISYTIPIRRINAIDYNGINLINNIILNNITNFFINASLINLYIPTSLINNSSIGEILINIIENMKIQLTNVFKSDIKLPSEINMQNMFYNYIGICFMIDYQEDGTLLNINDIKTIVNYALQKNIYSISYLTLQKDTDFNYYNVINNLIKTKQ